MYSYLSMTNLIILTANQSPSVGLSNTDNHCSHCSAPKMPFFLRESISSRTTPSTNSGCDWIVKHWPGFTIAWIAEIGVEARQIKPIKTINVESRETKNTHTWWHLSDMILVHLMYLHIAFVCVQEPLSPVIQVDHGPTDFPAATVLFDFASKCFSNNLMSKTYTQKLYCRIFVENSTNECFQLHDPRLRVIVCRMTYVWRIRSWKTAMAFLGTTYATQ